MASISGCTDTVKLLIARGARLKTVSNVRVIQLSLTANKLFNQNGMSALDWAERKNRTQTIYVLQAALEEVRVCWHNCVPNNLFPSLLIFLKTWLISGI